MAKFMVMGARSFSGQAFIRKALSKGHEVRGLSRPDYNVNTQLQWILSAVETERPDYFVNFAALNMVAESWEHALDYYQTNVLSLAKMHRWLLEWGKLKKYVQVSTPEVYGATHEILNESAPFHPSTPYAVSRAACDMDLLCLHRENKFPVVFTRTVNVYGEGQQLYRIIPKTVLLIARGEKLKLHGGGVTERSFIHIDDVSQAVYSVAVNGKFGETYHIATKRMVKIRTLVEMICKLMDVKFKDAVELDEERPGKDPAYLLDDSKIRSAFGWTDTIPLEEGLASTVDYYRMHADELARKPLEYVHKP